MYNFEFPITVVSEREMEFFDSIIRVLQLVLEVGLFFHHHDYYP